MTYIPSDLLLSTSCYLPSSRGSSLEVYSLRKMIQNALQERTTRILPSSRSLYSQAHIDPDLILPKFSSLVVVIVLNLLLQVSVARFFR